MIANDRLSREHLECDSGSSNCCNFSGNVLSVSYDLGLASGCTCTIGRAVMYVSSPSVMLAGQDVLMNSALLYWDDIDIISLFNKLGPFC